MVAVFMSMSRGNSERQRMERKLTGCFSTRQTEDSSNRPPVFLACGVCFYPLSSDEYTKRKPICETLHPTLSRSVPRIRTDTSASTDWPSLASDIDSSRHTSIERSALSSHRPVPSGQAAQYGVISAHAPASAQ